MSHTVRVPAQVTQREGVVRACSRLGMAEPQFGRKVYGYEACKDPVTVCHREQPTWPLLTADLADGQCYYDADYQQEVDAYLQAYATETAKMTAEQQGYQVEEQTLADGSVHLQVLVSH